VTTRSRTLPATLERPEDDSPNFEGTEAANGPCRAMWLLLRSTDAGNGASSGPNRPIEEAFESGSISCA